MGSALYIGTMPNRKALQDINFTALLPLKTAVLPSWTDLHKGITEDTESADGKDGNVIQSFRPNAVDRNERRFRCTKRLKESQKREMPVSFKDPVQLRMECGQLRQNSVTANPVQEQKN